MKPHTSKAYLLNGASRSGWEATAIPAPPTPPVDSDIACEALVIGAGYSGLNAAIRLAEGGKAVTVVDTGGPGYGASGRNGGQVIPGLKYDPDALLRKLGETAGRALIRFAGEAADRTFDLIEKYQIPCDAQRSGWLQPAVSEKTLRMVRGRAEQWQRHTGTDVKLLSAGQVRDLTGTDEFVGGWIDPRGGFLQPLSYARGLAQVALGLGVRVAGHSPVTRLSKQGAAWEAEVNGFRVVAPSVVLATNGYTGNLIPGLKPSLVPGTSVQVATEPLAEDLRETILPGGLPVSDTRRILQYMRFDSAGRFLMGGRGSFRPGEPARYYRTLRRLAEAKFPQLKGIAWQHRWAGTIALTADGLPHLHIPEERLYIALGYNGRGVAMASQMGRLLGELAIDGEREGSPFPITDIRPIPFHSCRAIGAEAIGTWYRTLDRFGL